MWVQFSTPWNWDVPGQPGVTLAFSTGVPINVTTPCGTAAIKAGVAEKMKAPPRPTGAPAEPAPAGDDEPE